MMAKKWIIAISIALGITVGAGAFIVYLAEKAPENLRAALVTIGSKATGLKVTIVEGDIGVFSGKGKIKEIKFTNPNGSNNGNNIVLKDVQFEVDPLSLWMGPIKIKALKIGKSLVAFDVSASQSSIKTLVYFANKYAREKNPEYSDNLIILDQMELVSSALKISIDLKGRRYVRSATLAPIKMAGIGVNKGGLTPARITEMALQIFVHRVNDMIVKMRLLPSVSKR